MWPELGLDVQGGMGRGQTLGKGEKAGAPWERTVWLELPGPESQAQALSLPRVSRA